MASHLSLYISNKPSTNPTLISSSSMLCWIDCLSSWAANVFLKYAAGFFDQAAKNFKNLSSCSFCFPKLICIRMQLFNLIVDGYNIQWLQKVETFLHCVDIHRPFNWFLGIAIFSYIFHLWIQVVVCSCVVKSRTWSLQSPLVSSNFFLCSVANLLVQTSGWNVGFRDFLK